MHTSTYKGTPVIVFLKDGSQIKGKFVKRHSRFVELDTAKIAKATMRAMVIDRHPPNSGEAKDV